MRGGGGGFQANSLRNAPPIHFEGHWKGWALKIGLFQALPFRVSLQGVGPENQDFFGTCHFEGHCKGWDLKIKIFWYLPFRGSLQGVGPENQDFFGTCHFKGHWKRWALKSRLFGRSTSFARYHFRAKKVSIFRAHSFQ
jgi:hypothetical protein